VQIAADETLILYTDGVIDALGEHDRFGLGRLKRVLSEHASKPPEELLAELELALERFQVGAQADDTAVLALRPIARTSPLGPEQPRSGGEARTLPVT
jgi:serine phosphatase RsbU (regulator of sigma subunit)